MLREKVASTLRHTPGNLSRLTMYLGMCIKTGVIQHDGAAKVVGKEVHSPATVEESRNGATVKAGKDKTMKSTLVVSAVRMNSGIRESSFRRAHFNDGYEEIDPGERLYPRYLEGRVNSPPPFRTMLLFEIEAIPVQPAAENSPMESDTITRRDALMVYKLTELRLRRRDGRHGHLFAAATMFISPMNKGIAAKMIIMVPYCAENIVA